MRQVTKTFLVGLVFVTAAAGCQRTARRHAFPATWPDGLDWSGSTSNLAAPPEPAGPAVAVEPFTLDTEAGAPSQAGGQTSTSRKLTDLMVEKLRQAGVQVSDSNAEYTLTGTVPKLGYTQRSGYPRKLYYTSELVYRLVHRPTGAVVWEGNLSQDFEQTVLVNTMTRLPSDPNAPERVLLEKCIDPNWAMIASDVKTYLKENPAPPQE
jgi:hypothetical protein